MNDRGKRVRDVGCYHLSYSALAWLRSTFDPVFCDAAVPCFYPCQRRTTNEHLRALLPKNVFCLLLLGNHLSPVVTVVFSPRCALISRAGPPFYPLPALRHTRIATQKGLETSTFFFQQQRANFSSLTTTTTKVANNVVPVTSSSLEIRAVASSSNEEEE